MGYSKKSKARPLFLHSSIECKASRYTARCRDSLLRVHEVARALTVAGNTGGERVVQRS